MNVRTQTESLTLKIGTSPPIALHPDTTRARLPRSLTPYKAPHSRTPIVSRDIGNSSGLQMYSPAPLHLRGNALDGNKTKNRRLLLLAAVIIVPTAIKLNQIIP